MLINARSLVTELTHGELATLNQADEIGLHQANMVIEQNIFETSEGVTASSRPTYKLLGNRCDQHAPSTGNRCLIKKRNVQFTDSSFQE